MMTPQEVFIQSRRVICKLNVTDILTIALCLCTLLITLFPIHTDWGEGELLLSYSQTVVLIAVTAWMAVKGRGMRIDIGDMLIVLYCGYYMLRCWWGAEYSCATTVISNMSLFMVYTILRAAFAGVLQRKDVETVLICGILLCGIYEAGYGMWQLFTGESRNHLFSVTGTFQNPGPYSLYLMMSCVIAMTWHPGHRVLRWLRLTVLLTAIAVLPATWSRAAFVGVGLLAMWHYRKHYHRWRYAVWGLLAVCAVGGYFLKQGSADGRVLIWCASLREWWDTSIWWGVGINGFSNALSDGIAVMYRSNPDNGLFASAGVSAYAFNDLLKVLVEQGVIGFVLCVAILTFALIGLFRQCRALFYGLLSLLISSMFSYPMELLPYRLLLVMLTAYGLYAYTYAETKKRMTFRKWATVIMLMLLVPVSAFNGRQIREYKRQHDEYRMISGMTDKAFIEDYYELSEYERDNADFWFQFGRTLNLNGKFLDSNAMLRKGVRLCADPMFHVMMGNNYCKMQQYDEAEHCYTEAFQRMPNRMYPLYKLMLMYKETGKRTEMLEYAERITAMKEKVESSATREMRAEAKRILTEKL